MVVIPNLGGGHLVFGSGEKRYHFQLLLPPIQIPPMTPLHDGNIRNCIVDHACQILKYETYGLQGPRLQHNFKNSLSHEISILIYYMNYLGIPGV